MRNKTNNRRTPVYEQEEAVAEALGVSLFNSELIELKFTGSPIKGLCIWLILSRTDFPSDSKKMLLEFEEVKIFNFNYNDDYHFYRIETAKLLKINGGYYLSLDPDDSLDTLSENDQDCIFAKRLRLSYPAQ